MLFLSLCQGPHIRHCLAPGAHAGHRDAGHDFHLTPSCPNKLSSSTIFKRRPIALFRAHRRCAISPPVSRTYRPPRSRCPSPRTRMSPPPLRYRGTSTVRTHRSSSSPPSLSPQVSQPSSSSSPQRHSFPGELPPLGCQNNATLGAAPLRRSIPHRAAVVFFPSSHTIILSAEPQDFSPADFLASTTPDRPVSCRADHRRQPPATVYPELRSPPAIYSTKSQCRHSRLPPTPATRAHLRR
jgi:hypothetical protein